MSVKDLLSGAPVAIAVLTALIVTTSAAREWAYYNVIGVDFISLTSPADYASIALVWLPSFVLLILVFAIYEMSMSRTEEFQSEEEIAKKSSNPRRIRFLRTLPYYFGVTVMIVGGFFRVIYVDNPSAMNWLLPVSGCWIVFCMWFANHPRVIARLAKTGRLLLFMGPPLVGYIVGSGYDEAVDDLSLPRGEYRVVYSTDFFEDDIQLLRTTSKGVLVLHVRTRTVTFLTYQAFERIEHIKSL